MPTPLYRFRLAKPDQDALAHMSKIYGAPNASVFIREMVTSMCSADPQKAGEFLARLMEKVTGQLALPLGQQEIAAEKNALQGAVTRAQNTLVALQEQASKRWKPVKKGRKATKRGKGAKRDKRAT